MYPCILYMHYEQSLCVLLAILFASGGTLVLASVWQYYYEHLVVHTPEYILEIYHANLVKLPWRHFFPDLSVLDQMAKVSCLNKLRSFSCNL